MILGFHMYFFTKSYIQLLKKELHEYNIKDICFHFIYIYIYIYIYDIISTYKALLWWFIIIKFRWVPVNSTGKVSNGCIRDLEFNPRIPQKLIGVLVWWQAIIRSGRHRLNLSQKKIYHQAQDINWSLV